MSFLETINQAQDLLERSKAISLRILKRELSLDEESLQDLVEELVDIRKVASTDGKALNWSGTSTRQEQGERRQLTVMFCDLVGSTKLAQDMDPEDFGELLHSYRNVCDEAAQTFEGHIAQYLGDGVLIYFGYPHAQEDAADRAIRAGLAIQQLLPQRFAARIKARIGVHTGAVVVDPTGAGDKALALGSATNVAARIQSIAEPGAVLASVSTLTNCRGKFDFKSLGEVELKGVEDPVQLFEIQSATGYALHDVSTPDRPMFGRDSQVTEVLNLWEQANDGQFQSVLITGEAGIGKSRLVQAVHERVASPSINWFDLQCSPFTSGSAFQPLIDLQRSYFELATAGSQIEARDSLMRRVEALSTLRPAEIVPYLLALHQLPASDSYPIVQTSAAEQRERTIRAMLKLISAITHEVPAVIVLEDLHWSDPSTEEFVRHLIGSTDDKKLLLLITSRPMDSAPFSRGRFKMIELSKLSPEDTRQMILQSAGARIAEPVLSALESRCDGVPLFINELTSNVVHSGEMVERNGERTLDVNLDEFAIPTTLQDSLMAKLDRLGGSKTVAQRASILGRQFSYELLQLVSDIDEPYLSSSLRGLVDSGVLDEEGTIPESTYTFRHALLQDAAYESQLYSSRRKMHATVVSAFEKHFPLRVASEPELIAKHCVAADMQSEAVDYYHRAAELAEKRVANREASNHYEHALQALAKLQSDEARQQREIVLRLALSKAQATINGYDSAEVRVNLERVEELCDQFSEKEQKLPGLMGLVEISSNRGNILEARERAEEILAIGESIDLPIAVATGRLILGGTDSELGNVESSRDRYRSLLEMPIVKQLPRPATSNDMDIMSVGLGAYACTLATIAQFSQCLATIEKAIERATTFGNDFTLSMILAMASLCGYQNYNLKLTRKHVEGAIDLSSGRGFHTSLTMAKILRGWALSMDGDLKPGLADIEEGLAIAEQTGVIPGLPLLLLIAADAYTLNGDKDNAMRQIEAAMTLVNHDGSFGYQPWILNTQARVELSFDNPDLRETKTRLLSSFDMSRSQYNRFAQLVAATKLAEIARETGDVEVSYSRLEGIRSQLEDYPDSIVMQEASAALDTLSELTSEATS